MRSKGLVGYRVLTQSRPSTRPTSCNLLQSDYSHPRANSFGAFARICVRLRHWMNRPIVAVALAGWIVSPLLHYSNEVQFRDNQIRQGSRHCAPSRYSRIERIEVAVPGIAGYAATTHLRSAGTGVILLLVSAAGCEFAFYRSHIQV